MLAVGKAPVHHGWRILSVALFSAALLPTNADAMLPVCGGGPSGSNAVTSVSPSKYLVANIGQTVTVAGIAQSDANQVTIKLNGANDQVVTLPGAAGQQNWSAIVPSAVIDTLADGTVAVTATMRLTNNTTVNATSSSFTKDTSAPAPVTALTSSPGAGQVGLTWTNPASDYGATRVLQSTTAFATDPTATAGQTVIFDGAGSGTTAGGLAGGTTYFFTAFVRDAAGNYSTSATAQGTPTVSMSVSFADSFNTCTSTSDLGANWTISGRWYCAGQKARGEVANGTALAKTASMGDTDVTVRTQLTGVATGSGPIARASGGSYYAAVILQSGRAQIIRVVGTTSTVLGTVTKTITPEPTTYKVRLHVTGSASVQLDAFVDGTPVLSVQDSSPDRLLSGQAGMLSGTVARTQYDDFSVVSQ